MIHNILLLNLISKDRISTPSRNNMLHINKINFGGNLKQFIVYISHLEHSNNISKPYENS